ncbi:MAG: glycosyltransferase family 39 protein [Deltaproteobacteria bacterium]|nr:glycosyltransferase family 39 protein [Deltaproteobacteria bacterium]
MTKADSELPTRREFDRERPWQRFFAWPASPYIGLFALALFVRLLYLHQIGDSILFETLVGDGRGFDDWAQKILSADERQGTFYQPPLYPYFLAAIYRFFGHDTHAVRVVQFVLGSASCVLLAGAVRAFFSRRAGLIAGVLLAIYPLSIYFDGIIQKTSLAQFFGALLLLLLGQVVDSRGRGIAQALAVGAALGGLSLLRENALAFAPICLLWLGQQAPQGQRVGRCVLFVVGLCLALSPAAWRNYEAGGVALPTTSQFGTNLYIGNHTGAPGYYVPLRAGRGDAIFERDDAQQVAEQAMGRELTPAEVSSFFTARTLSDIGEDFSGWLRLLAWKWALVWNVEELSDTDTWRAYADHSTLLYALGLVFHFGVLCPLAAFGVVASWGKRRRLWVLYALGLTVAFSVTLFFVFGRYRFPLVLVLVAFAAAGIANLREIRNWPRPRLAAAIGCGLATALFVNWPLAATTTDPRAVTYNSIGLIERDKGRIDSAIALFTRAIEIEPELWWARGNLANTLRGLGKLEESLPHYRRALLGTQDPSLGGEMALALLDLGRSQQAYPLLQHATQYAPPNATFQNGLGIAHIHRGELAEADYCFRLAIQLDPTNLDARRNLKTLELQRKLDSEPRP